MLEMQPGMTMIAIFLNARTSNHFCEWSDFKYCQRFDEGLPKRFSLPILDQSSKKKISVSPLKKIPPLLSGITYFSDAMFLMRAIVTCSPNGMAFCTSLRRT